MNLNYAIFRSEPIMTINDLAGIGAHNKREKKSYKSNPDIDIEKSKYNVELVPLADKYVIELTINNKKINFKNNKATINVYVSENKANVSYKLKDEKAKIKMNKIQNLKKEDNILNIEIIAENGTKVDYEITIYKYSNVEEIIYTIIFIIWFCGIVYLIYYFSKKIKTFTKMITKRK